ncbi:MAG: hypothetical protein LW636_06115 [Planctomycetaceae bacterium]|jgi:hypothetical protein|nr:hypothetical protein [Planctomycetaceae bacterium]
MNMSNTPDARKTRNSAARWTLLNAALLGMTAWIAFSQGSGLGTFAQASPPAQSSLDKDRAAAKSGQGDPFDPAARQLELLAEVRAIRTEVAALRELMRSGSAKVSIANADELKLDIDYKKMRDAMRAP